MHQLGVKQIDERDSRFVKVTSAIKKYVHCYKFAKEICQHLLVFILKKWCYCVQIPEFHEKWKQAIQKLQNIIVILLFRGA